MRHLLYAEPQLHPARLVLTESAGEQVAAYNAPRSFHHIERDGRWFRLAGSDRATGELVYLPKGGAA